MLDTIPLTIAPQAVYGFPDALNIAVNWVSQDHAAGWEKHVPAAPPARRKPRSASGEAETHPIRSPAGTRKRRPSGVDVPAAVFVRFVDALADGDHEFATLRETFTQWLAAIDAEPVSDVMLARWLKSAGLVKRRVGRAKVTVYRRARVSEELPASRHA